MSNSEPPYPECPDLTEADLDDPTKVNPVGASMLRIRRQMREEGVPFYEGEELTRFVEERLGRKTF